MKCGIIYKGLRILSMGKSINDKRLRHGIKDIGFWIQGSGYGIGNMSMEYRIRDMGLEIYD